MLFRQLPVFVLFVGALLTASARPAISQEAPPSGAAPAAPMPQAESPGLKGGVQELPVTGMYFRDKNGEQVFYPEMSLEKLVELLNRNADERPDQPPDVFIRRVDISGRAESGHASLNVEMEISAQRTGWRPVPLRFANAVVDQPADDGNTDRQFIVYDEDSGEHVCWINIEEPASTTIKFRLLAPLGISNGQTLLALDAPRAATDLALRISGAPVTARVDSGVANRLVETKSGNGATTLLVKGGGGDLRLSWGETGAAPQSTAAILESVGKITATIEDPRHVRYEAELTVSSLGGVFNSFRVRLPRAVELLPSNQANYRATPIEPANGDAAQGRIVEITPATPGQGPLTVRLRAATPRSASAPDTEHPMLTDLSGFAVLDAAQQRGRIDVNVEGDWSLSMHPDADMQSDQQTGAAAGGSNYAGFLFYRQPFSLRVDVSKKTARINVDPTYLFDVLDNRLQLRAVLNCRSRGLGAKELKIDLGDWNLDRVTPSDAFDFEIDDSAESNELALPLPTSPDLATLGFEAHLDFDAAAGMLEFSLPRIIESSSQQKTIVSAAAATIVVAPADSVQLTPLPEELQGMVAEPVNAQQTQLIESLGLAGRQPAPLVYRQRIDMGPSRFVGEFRVRPRTVTVAVRTNVEVGANIARVEQVLDHRVARGAVDKLLLQIPRALVGAGGAIDAEILIDGAAAQAVVVERDTSISDDQRVLAEAVLPASVQGDVELTVRYQLPLGEFGGGKQRTIVLSLVTPAEQDDVVLAAHELRVTTIEDAAVRLADTAWREVQDESSSEGARPLVARAQGGGEAVSLLIAAGIVERSQATIVRKTWLQTWLTQTKRRDRVVFAISTDENRVQVGVPEGAAAESVVVAVDGQRANFAIGENPRIIQIDLGDQPDEAERIVELIYMFDGARSGSHNISLDAPQVLGAAATDRTYWQLVTPQREHLLTSPAQLTPELIWQRRGWYWDRQASLTQLDLEQWSGAKVQADMQLPAETNKYLFSTLGPVERIEIWTVSLWTVVLAASAAVLLFALVFMRQPVLRRGEVVLAAGVLFVAVALLHAEAAMLLAQAAVLGLAAAVLGGGLQWLFIVRRQTRTVVHGKTYSSADSNVVDVLPMHREGGSQATTATAPKSTPVVEAESNA